MPTYYMTFGSGHYTRHGQPLGNRYCPVEAKSVSLARLIIDEVRSNIWCGTYFTPRDAGVERYGLYPISLKELAAEDGVDLDEMKRRADRRYRGLPPTIDEINLPTLYLVMYRTMRAKDVSHFQIFGTIEELLGSLGGPNAKRVSEWSDQSVDILLFDVHGNMSGVVHKVDGACDSMSPYYPDAV